eukprot:168913_1
MSGLLRSEPMSYLEMLIPSEAAHDFVNTVGHEESMDFVDLNTDLNAFDRRFMGDIVEIGELERLVRVMEGFLSTHEVKFDDFLSINDVRKTSDTATVPRLKVEISEIYKSLQHDINVEESLATDLKKQEDLEHVLLRTEMFMGHQHQAEVVLQEQQRNLPSEPDTPLDIGHNMESPLLERAAMGVRRSHGGVTFRFIAGVVTDSQRPAFERQVYLTSRGNTYSLMRDIPNENRSTFVVFYLGNMLAEKLDRLCKFMGIDLYLTSDKPVDVRHQLEACRRAQGDLETLLNKTRTGLFENLHFVASQVAGWKLALMQEKAIRYTLNKFRESKRTNILHVEGWCPTKRKHEVELAINQATASKGMAPSAVTEKLWKGRKTPPTYFETNKFTKVFQNIVSTYGVPRYGEVNPTLFTIITFPFLFAVMYGDVFHGSCLALASFSIILREKKLGSQKLSEFAQWAYDGRYCLFVMGLFSVYCGVLYNDCMSIPMHGFESGWKFDPPAANSTDVFLPVTQLQKVYPFGVDYVWAGGGTELKFYNSLKMKMSIVLGVSHMLLGIICSLLNKIHFKDFLGIWTEFLPQVVFIMSLFGWMSFLIIYKWTVNWDPAVTTFPPPSIISMMIGMFLDFGDTPNKQQMFPDVVAQGHFQTFLVLSAGLSIPWMLLSKPLILRFLHNKRSKRKPLVASESEFSQAATYARVSGVDIEDSEDSKENLMEPMEKEEEEEEFDFSNIMIMQMIHTIEYVLGTISNTASYLRLWALSLAHAELSLVIFEQILSNVGFKSGNSVLVFITTPIFFAVTFAVLLTTDVLECFLHALRLHWVEFQNKFYAADGIAFEPLSYKDLITEMTAIV